jgi:tetratricopeptide (TPR) repeat protein
MRITLFTVLLFCIVITSAYSAAERRTALVIGNGSYTTGSLRNPVNDATVVASTLKKLGFDVILKENALHKDMENAIREFGDRLKKGGVGLFFYAGHGVQLNGKNYLIPIGASLSRETDAKYAAVDADMILDEMGNAGNYMNIVILDACRDNPFGKTFRSASRGLAIVSDAPQGTLISYSTSPGKVAADGSGGNSPYTSALVRHMVTPGLPIEEVFKRVRQDISKKTQGQQIPWELSSLEGQFFFAPKPGSPEGAGIGGERTAETDPEEKANVAEQERLQKEKERLSKEREVLDRAKTKPLSAVKEAVAVGPKPAVDPFQEVVARYLAADPKPQLPEEVRKFNVRAQYAIKESRFSEAAGLYAQGLEVTPWWPSGHFNRALVLGHLKNYQEAAQEMKMYVRLSPDAPDVRAAQDKVYLWEELAKSFAPKETRRDGRFIAYNNGTVSDTKTNLMWAAKDNGSNINWANAKSYCENYRGGGYSDWRMPTQDELAGLYDAGKSRPGACNTSYPIHVATELIDITCLAPWASETSGSDAAYFNFSDGGRHWGRQSNVGIRALPVRFGK